MKHTPEPWFIAFGGNDGDDYAVIGAVGRERPVCELGTLDYTKPNADRIVACVNACAGIDDPPDLRRQRDELLEACRVALSRYQATIDAIAAAGYPDNDPNRNRLEADVKTIRAAIVNAEQTTDAAIQWGPATGGSASAKYGRKLTSSD